MPAKYDNAFRSRDQTSGISAADIGFAVGAAGGTVNDAARLQYVLSCMVPPGHTPTPDQIGKAVGILKGGVSEALVIEELLSSQRSSH